MTRSAFAVAADLLDPPYYPEDEDWRVHPAAFAAHLTAGQFKRWRYVELLSRKFKEACDGTSKRQIWNVPARYGKSVLGSQWGPAWQFDRRPGSKFILVSYGQTLAVENAIAIRRHLLDHEDVLRCSLSRDRRKQDRFTTNAGGGILAAGATATIRGFGAGNGGGIIIDDPFKNWQEAHSEHARDDVWGTFRGTLLDRLDDESAFILVIHHRVHEDDLSGRLIAEAEREGDVYDVTVLPALAVDNDLLGRAPGETLEPERFSRSFHLGLQRSMGTYLFSSLQQQDPTPEEGNIVKRAWWKIGVPPLRFDEGVTSWDMKLKEKESGDYVVGQAWGRVGPDLWLIEQLRGQWDQATTRAAMALLAHRHPWVAGHVYENAGNAPEVTDELRRAHPGYVLSDEICGALGIVEDEREGVQEILRRGLPALLPKRPTTDKATRMRAVSPMIEAGNVHLNESLRGLEGFLDEMSAFDQGTYDDQVDACSQALARLGRGGAELATPGYDEVPHIGRRRSNGLEGLSVPSVRGIRSRHR